MGKRRVGRWNDPEGRGLVQGLGLAVLCLSTLFATPGRTTPAMREPLPAQQPATSGAGMV